jgi:predicted lipoprotein with Yx(FWY)xxD motif
MAGLEAGDAVDPAILSIAPRSGGDPQLVVAGQPAYYFVEDLRPGAVSGHGTDGTWFVFRADGSMMRPSV